MRVVDGGGRVADRETAALELLLDRKAHPEEPGAAAFCLSKPEQEAIREELDRLLASALFRTSHRSRDLLNYVVEQALIGNTDSFKERIVGISAFNRDPAYDTANDPVVRTSASELRKKLALYYYDSANQGRVLIELPTGSYSPVFRFKDTAQSTADEVAARPIEEAPEAEAEQTLGPASGQLHSDATSEVGGLHLRWKWIGWAAVGLLAVAGALLAHTYLFRSTQDLLWAPLLASEQPVSVCPGDFGSFDSPDSEGPDWLKQRAEMMARIIAERKLPPRLENEPALPQVPFVDVLATAQATAYLASHQKRFAVLRESDTTLADLRRGPTILIGGFDNEWALLVLSNLRYRLRIDPVTNTKWIEDTQDPSRKDWKITGQPKYYDSFIDYAIVTRLLYPETGQWILSAAGLSAHGTQAAEALLTAPPFAASLPPILRSRKKNFQIVLKVTTAKGQIGRPEIVALYSW